MSNDSVSQWLTELNTADAPQAQQKLWERYFDKLQRLIVPRLPKRLRRSFDEEDVALSAMQSFFAGITKERFPQLADRNDLWKILVVIAARKTQEHLRHAQRQKRGGGHVRGESALHVAARDERGPTFDDFLADTPDPKFAALVSEECERLLQQLGSDDLRSIAVLKMEGFTVSEIAEQLGFTKRTVERRLQIIRKKWEVAVQVEDGES